MIGSSLDKLPSVAARPQRPATQRRVFDFSSSINPQFLKSKWGLHNQKAPYGVISPHRILSNMATYWSFGDILQIKPPF
jgi:hypothetical protein